MSVVASYSFANGDSGFITYGNFGQGQTFQFSGTDAYLLDSVQVQLNHFSTVSGNVTAYLYAISGTYGSTAIPTGSALGTSGSIAASSITESFPSFSSTYTFTFSGANRYMMLPNTAYVFVIRFNGGDSSHIVAVNGDNSSSSYGGNLAYEDPNNGGVWTQSANADLVFNVNGTLATTPRTQTGISRITAITTKVQTGKSRITGTTVKTQTGKADIRATTQRTQSGKAFIGSPAQQTQTGKARIQVTTARTQAGVADIKKSIPRAQTGISRITRTIQQAQTGVGNIIKLTSRTQLGKAAIRKSVSRSQTGVASIIGGAQRTITGKAFILERFGLDGPRPSVIPEPKPRLADGRQNRPRGF